MKTYHYSVKFKGFALNYHCEFETVFTEKEFTREEVNATFKAASEGQFKGIIEFSELPLVSSDIVSNKYSAIFDSKLTLVRGNMLRVFAWYDNESGYSARLAELAAKV